MFLLYLIGQTGYTEELAQYFVQQYVSHPININTATAEELRYIPFLSEEDIQLILKRRPFRSMSDFRRALNLSYREYSLIRYYIYIPSRPYRGYVSFFGGLQYRADSTRGYGNVRGLRGILNHIVDHEFDVQAGYRNAFARFKTFTVAVKETDTTYHLETRNYAMLNLFGRDYAFRIGHFGPRAGYGAISYRPRYYFLYQPSYLFPSYIPSVEIKYRGAGVFVDTSKNAFIYWGKQNFSIGFIHGNYDALWGQVELSPAKHVFLTLEGVAGSQGQGFTYSIQYKNRGVFVFWTQSLFRGDTLWRYSTWTDSTFFYVSAAFYPFYVRFAIRGEKGTITGEYELFRGTRIYFRHYRHPFFRSYSLAISQSRGLYAQVEKVRKGGYLTLGYNFVLFGRYGNPYVKLRVYIYDFGRIVDVERELFDPEYREFRRYGWSAYEGFFPGVDSRIRLKGRGVRASMSVRWKGWFFRWVDGGRWEIGLDKEVFF